MDCTRRPGVPMSLTGSPLLQAFGRSPARSFYPSKGWRNIGKSERESKGWVCMFRMAVRKAKGAFAGLAASAVAVSAAFAAVISAVPARAEERQMVIIGDSRTEDLHNTVADSGCVWSYKVGAGISWMMEEGAPAVDRYIGDTSAVVVLLGVNDCAYPGTADLYISYINERAADWTGRGADVYYVSVTPVDESIIRDNATNAGILTWNRIMSEGLSGDIHYVDIYDDMLDGLCSCRIAAMTCLNPNAQIIIVLFPPVVFHFEKDPVKQPCFVAVHQLGKYAVVLVDQ